jgi:hypothetical protein
MEDRIAGWFADIESSDREVQHRAFLALMAATETPVDWAYEVWDDLLSKLSDPNNRQRAIAAQLLCALAKSDPKNRILKDFDRILQVTHDERFVTARHTLQSLWKIGVVGPRHKKILLEGLEKRYRGCADEKNGTLVRYDILESFRKIHDHGPDEKIRQRALELIEIEEDPKYRKKYATLWKK